MLGSTTWFTVPWSGQKHQQSRSPMVSAETTERDPMAWRWYHGSRGVVPHGKWRLLTHWQHSACRKMRFRQEVLQRPRLRERRPITVRSPPLACFYLVAVETLGPLLDKAHSLIAEIGRRAALCTADPRETMFLYQRIKSNQIIWFIRYSNVDAELQQYRGNAFTTNNITSSVSWQHNSSGKNN